MPACAPMPAKRRRARPPRSTTGVRARSPSRAGMEQPRQCAARAGRARRSGGGVRARRDAKPDYALACGQPRRRCSATWATRRARKRRCARALRARRRTFARCSAARRRSARARRRSTRRCSFSAQAIEAAPMPSAAGSTRGHAGRARRLARRARPTPRPARATRPILRTLFGDALTLPMIYADGAAVEAARAGFETGLARSSRAAGAIARKSRAEVLDGLRWINFFLAYQGATIAICRAVMPRWRGADRRRRAALARAVARRPRPARRVRVGFASAFFHDGTCGRYFGAGSPISTASDSRSSSITCGRDVTTSLQARRRAGRSLPHVAGRRARRRWSRPRSAPTRSTCSSIPSSAWTRTLRAGRAAAGAAQCAAWGHPVTTGHATIDAFFTCAAMEPADATRITPSRWCLLPGIGTRYVRPSVPADAIARALRACRSVPLLLCPQSLFKIHPDNDALFARVLAAKPAARARAFRRTASGDHRRQVHARGSRGVRRDGMPIREARVLPAARRTRRLSAHQRGLRRDARHAALVGWQHQPRRAGVRVADRHVARAVHARPAERGDAASDGNRRARCA